MPSISFIPRLRRIWMESTRISWSRIGQHFVGTFWISSDKSFAMHAPLSAEELQRFAYWNNPSQPSVPFRPRTGTYSPKISGLKISCESPMMASKSSLASHGCPSCARHSAYSSARQKRLWLVLPINIGIFFIHFSKQQENQAS